MAARLGRGSGWRSGRAPSFIFSTDYVFLTGKRRGCISKAIQLARGVSIGRSKLEGELAVAEVNPRHIVLRNVMGLRPVRQQLRAHHTFAWQQNVIVFRWSTISQDCPTYAPDMAGAIIAIRPKN